MYGRIVRNIIILLLMVFPFTIFSETPLTPFPHNYKSVPTISLTSPEPLRVNLSNYIPGVAPDLVSRISYLYQDQGIIVFQSPENPLDIAIIYPHTLNGYTIFPLLFEFSDGVKSPFFIAAEILSPDQEKKAEKPGVVILPYQKKSDKTKGIDEYVFYFYDPKNLEEPVLDKIKVILGNERLIYNIGLQDQMIFIPLPRGEMKDKPLRIFAQSKKGTWAEECIVMEPEAAMDKPADWREAVFYLALGKRAGDERIPSKSAQEDRLTSYPLTKDDLLLLEQKIEKRYFNKLFIDILFCPKQKITQEWNNFIDTAHSRNMEIIVSSGVFQSFHPVDSIDFKTVTQWNPLITELIHQAFGSNTTGMNDLHESSVEFKRAVIKKGIVPAISLNLPGKPRLVSLITETSQGKEDLKMEYPLKYQYHKMAFGYLTTFSGVPIMLYGDEIGIEKGDLSLLNQEPTKEQKALLKDISRILEVRKEHLALTRGETVDLFMEKEQIVYLKTYFNSQIICAFNRSNEESQVTVSLPPFISNVKKVEPLLKSGGYTIEKRKIHIKLPPVSLELYLLNP